MFDAIFEQIGLNAIDAKVYEQLMKMSTGTPSSVSKAVNVSRENTYYILKKLVELGLVVQVPDAKKLTYQIASAENLTRLFEKKEEQLEKSKSQLNDAVSLINSHLSENSLVPTVRYFQNVAGVKQAYYNFLENETNAEILGISNYNAEMTEELEEFFVVERIKKELPLKLLIIEVETALRYRRTNPKELRETRIMPSIDFPKGIYFAVLRNRVLIVNRATGSDLVGVGIVIEHVAIANAFRSMFHMIWAVSKTAPKNQTS